MTQGPGAYDELLAMEGQIRKQRQETVYKQQKIRQQILEVIGWIFLSVILIGAFTLVATILVKKSKAETNIQPKVFIIREELINDK